MDIVMRESLSNLDLSPEAAILGCQWIAGQAVPGTGASFNAISAEHGETLPGTFFEADRQQIQSACQAAEDAFWIYSDLPDETRASFLEAIAEEVINAGDRLLERCEAETALPRARLEGERLRTVNQARLFAQVVRDGHWQQARIDHAQTKSVGGASPDCRSLWCPVGPVAVFGASNFPLAISVVGNDTIAALAAGCPVVVKAHPAHPGTCEILARAMYRAIARCGLPLGLFSLLHGRSHQVGTDLVQHPAVQAVGFTGSLAGGRALYDAVAQREQLIPVYAEMGSVNPVFLLPSALQAERLKALSAQMVASIAAGGGQMCTQPGLILGTADTVWEALKQEVRQRIVARSPYTLLHQGIAQSYREGLQSYRQELQEQPSETQGQNHVPLTGEAQDAKFPGAQVEGSVWEISVEVLLQNQQWQNEVFGPSSVFVNCESLEQMIQFAKQMKGSLTASIHGSESELVAAKRLVQILQQKAGRLIFNGFPTGVEVNHAMMHGGPYPAAIGSFTSIGTGSIQRFARPLCFQDFPSDLLPAVLQDRPAQSGCGAKAHGTLRMIDGKYQW